MDKKFTFTEIEGADNRIRFAAETEFSVVANEGKRATLSGYAMVWGAVSNDRGGYRVRLLPNSATFLTPTFALYHHSFRDVLARNDDGSLRITMDDIGAKVEIDLPDTQLGRDLEWLVSNRKVRGMSFAMIPGKFNETNENGQRIKNYSEYNVDEVTITAIPAFNETSIGVAEDKADNNLSDVAKEYDAALLKQEQYRNRVYSLWLAEHQPFNGEAECESNKHNGH
jgi:HK97 family phage prohead protease